MIELILTVCTIGAPSHCDERRLQFVDQGETLMQCMMWAPPTLAHWAEEHPGNRIARWRCAYPGSEGQPT